MRQTREPLNNSDIVPGAFAALALLALVFPLHMPFLLGVVLAGLVYFGLRLALHKPAPPDLKQVTEEEMIAQLEALSRRIPFSGPRQQVAQVVDQARAILNYLTPKNENATLWRGYLRECLDSMLQGTGRFVELAPRLQNAGHPSVAEYSKYSTTMLSTLEGVSKKLVDDDAADFTAHIETFQNSLNDLNQIYLGEGKLQ